MSKGWLQRARGTGSSDTQLRLKESRMAFWKRGWCLGETWIEVAHVKRQRIVSQSSRYEAEWFWKQGVVPEIWSMEMEWLTNDKSRDQLQHPREVTCQVGRGQRSKKTGIQPGWGSFIHTILGWGCWGECWKKTWRDLLDMNILLSEQIVHNQGYFKPQTCLKVQIHDITRSL